MLSLSLAQAQFTPSPSQFSYSGNRRTATVTKTEQYKYKRWTAVIQIIYIPTFILFYFIIIASLANLPPDKTHKMLTNYILTINVSCSGVEVDWDAIDPVPSALVIGHAQRL